MSSLLMAFLQASSRFSASTTMCWYIGTRYWCSITNLGIGFSPVGSSNAQSPSPTVEEASVYWRTDYLSIYVSLSSFQDSRAIISYILLLYFRRGRFTLSNYPEIARY